MIDGDDMAEDFRKICAGSTSGQSIPTSRELCSFMAVPDSLYQIPPFVPYPILGIG